MTPQQKFVIYLMRSFLIVTSILSLFDYIDNPKSISNQEYQNYKFILFTKISLFITVISAVSGIINRLTGNYHFIRNFLLPISFTFEFIVTLVYWLLYLLDKKLIVDSNTLIPGNEITLFSMISSHVFPMVLGYLEYVDFTPKPNDYHMMFFVLFGIFYYIVVTLYATAFGKYIYPFLDNLGPSQRFMFFVGTFALGIVVHRIQYKIFGRY